MFACIARGMRPFPHDVPGRLPKTNAERARLAALPENVGKGVIQLNGRMVELLHADMARRTLAIVDAIAERSKAAA